MRKFRILHLIKSLNRGGAETLLADGIRFADQERFELSYGYFHPRLDALVATLADRGGTVTCFGGGNHLGMLARVGAVAHHLRSREIDLLHCHLPTAGVVGRLAARLAGVPVVYTEHNKPEWYRRPTFLLNAWTYDMQERVIAVSESVQESIAVHIHTRIPVTVIRNGIDASCFHRADWDGTPVRRRFDIPGDAVVVGNVAALIPQKCLLDWIAAAALVNERRPGVHFLLIGDGPMRLQLSRRIAELHLEDVVHLCGVQSDVRPYLAAIDVYMMSSAFEGLPVALLEAMAMACAPVCTAVGGIPEVIGSGRNGYLTEPFRPDALAELVTRLVDDPTRRRAIADVARREVETDFRIERMIRAVERTYLDVLEPRMVAPPLANSRVANATYPASVAG